MKITVVLAVLIGSFVLACSSGALDPTEPAFKVVNPVHLT
jgi:FlaG/FlaF family flagellin (archaellin)